LSIRSTTRRVSAAARIILPDAPFLKKTALCTDAKIYQNTYQIRTSEEVLTNSTTNLSVRSTTRMVSAAARIIAFQIGKFKIPPSHIAQISSVTDSCFIQKCN